MGPDVLVPYSLVFGEPPRIILQTEYGRRLITEERSKFVNIWRHEMKHHLDLMRFKCPLNHNVLGKTDANYEHGECTRLEREGPL